MRHITHGKNIGRLYFIRCRRASFWIRNPNVFNNIGSQQYCGGYAARGNNNKARKQIDDKAAGLGGLTYDVRLLALGAALEKIKGFTFGLFY